MEQLEGRNPVVECLKRGKRQIFRIDMDERAKPDHKITSIFELARAAGVRVDPVPRAKLDKVCDGRVHNGVVAYVGPLDNWSAKSLLDAVFDKTSDPFFVLADTLQYEHNLGAILRTSLGFGVNGFFIPTRRGASISPVVQRVSMGAVEEIPIVREGLHSSLKQIKKAGIRVVGADMGGVPIHKSRLSGPLALIMGGEGKGLSSSLRRQCDEIVSIPLAGDLESLNVSVAASLIMYEKRRQDGWFSE